MFTLFAPHVFCRAEELSNASSSVCSYEFFVCLGARTPGLFLGRWFLIHDALLIEREQAFENLFVSKIDRKTVGSGDSSGEFCMRICEPVWMFVVDVRERALP